MTQRRIHYPGRCLGFLGAADGSAPSSCFQSVCCVGGPVVPALTPLRTPPKADINPRAVMPVVFHDELTSSTDDLLTRVP